MDLISKVIEWRIRQELENGCKFCDISNECDLRQKTDFEKDSLKSMFEKFGDNCCLNDFPAMDFNEIQTE